MSCPRHSSCNHVAIGLLLLIHCSFVASLAAAQGTISVTTDKSAYDYGESIEISVTIVNETPTLFRLPGSSTCQANFTFDSFESARHTICTLDAILIDFNPGSWRTWTWTIDPEILGLPNQDGDHSIVGYYGGTNMADTVTVSAPAYKGGQLLVGITSTTTDNDLATIKDSLHATVLSSSSWLDGRRSEVWQMSGMTVEAAINLFAQDARFYSLDANRMIRSARIVAIEELASLPDKVEPISFYPNPCSGLKCVGKLGIHSPQHITVSVFDLLGRQLSIISEYVSSISPAYRLEVDTSSLINGMYWVRVLGDDVSATGGLLVVR